MTRWRKIVLAFKLVTGQRIDLMAALSAAGVLQRGPRVGSTGDVAQQYSYTGDFYTAAVEVKIFNGGGGGSGFLYQKPQVIVEEF